MDAKPHNPFDWHLMRSFLAVLDGGSLQAAARQLGMAQPTVGRHMAQLEAQLGVALFERAGQQLVPTAAARQVAEQARTMQEGADAVARLLTGQGHLGGQTVRISTSQVAATHLLPPLLAPLLAAEPDLQIELVATNTISNLVRREADIAVRMVRPTQGSLLARHVGSVAIGAYATPGYLRRCGTPTTMSELARHLLVGFDHDPSVIDAAARMGWPLRREQFRWRSDDHLAAWAAVRAGVGIGFAACYVGDAERAVRRVLPALPIPSLPVWVAVHREVRGHTLIRRVYEHLRDALVARLRAADT
ncbi:MAG: LysR family transcriptional regulator [Proteobacteria bacterium]|nr:LysR family transcriptional regulator [Pseudomonadota bacterium]